MANKHRGIYEIHLDQPRKIQFTFGALAELEDKLGMKITQLNDAANIGAKEMLALVWAGLLKHENLSFDEVDELLSQAAAKGRFTEIIKTVLEAFGQVFGGGDAGKSEEMKAMMEITGRK